MVDEAIPIAAILLVTLAVLSSAITYLLAERHARRMASLDLADRIQSECLHRAERVIEDARTSHSIASFCLLACKAMGERSFARALAANKEHIGASDTSKSLAKLFHELEALQKHPVLLRDFAFVIFASSTVSLLKWPETEALGVANVEELTKLEGKAKQRTKDLDKVFRPLLQVAPPALAA